MIDVSNALLVISILFLMWWPYSFIEEQSAARRDFTLGCHLGELNELYKSEMRLLAFPLVLYQIGLNYRSYID